MGKKVLIVLGHPDSDSLCGSLAAGYEEGAKETGAEVRTLRLGEMQFDPVLHKGYREVQTLEPHLVAAQEALLWAEHLVWVYPTWWGTYPAVLKGFLDRVFLPGFAFKYRPNSPWWDKYLTGRSGRIIVTLDAPRVYNWWMYGSANHKALRKATLEFCGISPVGVTTFDRVKFADEAKRRRWIEEARSLGRRLI